MTAANASSQPSAPLKFIQASVQNPIIVMREVSFSYQRVPILHRVNLEVYPNELITIVGPNGGGKTTLLKLILGLLRPTAGSLTVFGAPPEQARTMIGYTPQHVQFDPHFPITVKEVVLMGRLAPGGWRHQLGWYNRADQEQALQALQEVGMTDFTARPFYALSGGQRQRVLIARALACNPQLLLLDEPMANVDTTAEAKLMAILEKLRTRMAILMVSHDLGLVSNVVRRVICVNREVRLHATGELTAELLQDLYSCDLRVVLHDTPSKES